MPSAKPAFILVLIGVSGSGKTTVGKLLAGRLGWRFLEGDRYHPAGNIRKMRAGIPLTDADRRPWLARLRRLLLKSTREHRPLILACSALKASYRRTLRVSPMVRFVYLKAGRDRLARRLRRRRGHYMKADMLPSQLAAFEEPPQALIVNSERPAQVVAREILKFMRVV
jgi:carbohydrate kinase (thermoresistant glucokinase family)